MANIHVRRKGHTLVPSMGWEDRAQHANEAQSESLKIRCLLASCRAPLHVAA